MAKMTRKDYEQRAVEYRIAFMSGYKAGYDQGAKTFSDMVDMIFRVLLKKQDVDRVMKIAAEELAKLKVARRAASKGKIIRGEKE